MSPLPDKTAGRGSPPLPARADKWSTGPNPAVAVMWSDADSRTPGRRSCRKATSDRRAHPTPACNSDGVQKAMFALP